MAEETQEGTWSSLKKTLVGTLATVVTAGGAWLGSTLFGGGSEDKAPVQAAPVININNTQQQTQTAGGKTVIVKEKESTKKDEPAKPVKTKEGDEFKNQDAKW